jgi:folate-dependent tRNA-U54 methylase TrmFO/GidA
VANADPRHYQPTNITFGIMPAPEPPPGSTRMKKVDRKQVTSDRALRDLAEWMQQEV